MKTILIGDNLQTLRALEEGSVDSIVTDPPYGFEFMNKAWDYDVPGVELWRECLRVLKPGGHLLSFCGARTYHRLVVNIEDAGFEIRDQLMWLYGSGFPKNLDLGRAIDAADAPGKQRERQLRFTEWMRGTGLSASQINQATETSMGGHYLTDKEQPAIATREHLEKLRPLIGEIPAWVEEMCDQRSAGSDNLKARKPKSVKKADMTAFQNIGGESVQGWKIKTKAHTEQARRYEGWGTALKPAHEPIVLARKPFKGTVAENVLRHGTGGINIGGCSVPAEGEPARFPANVILDGSEEVLAGFPYSTSGPIYDGTVGGKNRDVYKSSKGYPVEPKAGSAGSAGRFFYHAKATKRDRDEGLKDAGLKNNVHPTVKPTALMAYLVRLITPPGGVVLDPFAGSGSTGKAAILEGFSVVLCEREREYIPIIEARTAWAERVAEQAKSGRGLSALELALLLENNEEAAA